MRLIEQSKERLAQAAEAAERASDAVAQLEARRVDLELRLVEEREAALAAESRSVLARLSGDAVAAGEHARLRDAAWITAAALAEIGKQAEAAAVVLEAARAAHASAQKIEASLVVAAALRERGGQAIEALAALFQTPGARDCGAVQILTEALGLVQHSPDRSKARIEEAARNIEARAAAQLGPAAEIVNPAPAADTFVFARRAFKYRFRDGSNLAAPSNWLGEVPGVVADRLVALGAAKRLAGVSWYFAAADIAGGDGDQRFYVDAGRRALLPEDVAEPLVKEGRLSRLANVDVGLADVRAAYASRLPLSGDQSFSGALDLGLIDAAPSTVSAAASDTEDAAPRSRARRQLVRSG